MPPKSTVTINIELVENPTFELKLRVKTEQRTTGAGHSIWEPDRSKESKRSPNPAYFAAFSTRLNPASSAEKILHARKILRRTSEREAGSIGLTAAEV